MDRHWNRNQMEARVEEWRTARVEKMAARLQLNSNRPRTISSSVLGYGNYRHPMALQPNHRHGEGARFVDQRWNSNYNNHTGYREHNSPRKQYHHQSDHRADYHRGGHGSFHQHGQKRVHFSSHKSLYDNRKSNNKANKKYSSCNNISTNSNEVEAPNNSSPTEQNADIVGNLVSESALLTGVSISQGSANMGPISHLDETNLAIDSTNVDSVPNTVCPDICSNMANDHSFNAELEIEVSQPQVTPDEKLTIAFEATVQNHDDTNSHDEICPTAQNVESFGENIVSETDSSTGLSIPQPCSNIGPISQLDDINLTIGYNLDSETNAEVCPEVYENVDNNTTVNTEMVIEEVSQPEITPDNKLTIALEATDESSDGTNSYYECQTESFLAHQNSEIPIENWASHSNLVTDANTSQGSTDISPMLQLEDANLTIGSNVEIEENNLNDVVYPEICITVDEDSTIYSKAEIEHQVEPDEKSIVFVAPDGTNSRVVCQNESFAQQNAEVVNENLVSQSDLQVTSSDSVTGASISQSSSEIGPISQLEQEDPSRILEEKDITKDIQHVENRLANITIGNQDCISDSEGLTPMKKGGRRKVLLDATNILQSSTIKYSVREVRKNDESEIIVTPVRRSMRISSVTPISRQNLCVEKLEELSPEAKQKFKFVSNPAISVPPES